MDESEYRNTQSSRADKLGMRIDKRLVAQRVEAPEVVVHNTADTPMGYNTQVDTEVPLAVHLRPDDDTVQEHGMRAVVDSRAGTLRPHVRVQVVKYELRLRADMQLVLLVEDSSIQTHELLDTSLELDP